jgi:hypothetical protein
MYRHFIESEDYVPVPLTGFTLKVNRRGELIDEDSQPVITWTDTQGNTYAHVFAYRGYDDYQIEELILLAFKPLLLPVHYWHKLSVGYLTDSTELDIGNLTWVYPPQLEVKELPGFYYIPGHAQYAVTNHGVVINIASGDVANQYPKDGYRRVALRTDLNKWITTGTHRVVCAAIHGSPANVDELDVNHDDFDRANNRSSNVGWITRLGNIKHSNEREGKVHISKPSQRVPVWIRYPKTGQVLKLEGRMAASRHLGVSPVTINTMGAKADTQPLYDNEYQLSIGEEEPTWRDVKPHEYDSVYVIGKHRPVKVRWAETGIVKYYDSALSCGEALGIHKDTVLHRIKDGGQSIWDDGTQVKDALDDTPWGTTDDWERRRKSKKRSKRLELRNVETGEITAYKSLKEMAKNIGILEESLSVWTRKKGFPIFPVKGFPLGVQFRLYNDLEDWRIPEDPLKELDAWGSTRTILRRDVRTGVVDRFDRMVDCAKDCGVGKTTIAFRLKSNGLITYQGQWQYQYYNDNPVWG